MLIAVDFLAMDVLCPALAALHVWSCFTQRTIMDTPESGVIFKTGTGGHLHSKMG